MTNTDRNRDIEIVTNMVDRFDRCMRHTGTDAEFAEAAVVPARAAIERLAAAPINELVGICQWIEKTFDMGADRSQLADPAIIARRDIYAGILARIVELKEGA